MTDIADPSAARRLASHVFGPWQDPAEVRARGVGLRERTPVAALGAYAPAARRPDPVGIVDAANAERVTQLIGLRVGRMVTSPFAFLRGTAGLMAADLADSPTTGIAAQICGDAHASNFGLYASPERRLVMDVNDFDETVVGPWEWDLKRLAASLVVAGRQAGVNERGCRDAASDCARTYRAAMRELATMPVLEAYYLTTDQRTLERFGVEDLAEVFDRVSRKAKKNTGTKVAAKLTQRVGQAGWRFVEDPPVLTRVDDATAAAVLDGVGEYADGCLDTELRWVLSRYSVADVAHRVVGLGSVGLRSYVVLLHGNGEDALILQVKEARASALAPYVAPSGYPHEGARIVRGQRWMQTVSDILLGWTTVEDRPFLVRQFRDMKGSIDPTELEGSQLDDYGRVVGAVLARAHAQSVDPRLLSGYADGQNADDGKAFDAALTAFAVAYADQTQADHAALVEAVRTGRLPATHWND
ncbi:MAG TPA: DUF2252 domain-containing protein [Cryptosporangiaceae bacterium]|nr:DUF2252 domain-containing protein [Cryptosporangiaceae bacterium]